VLIKPVLNRVERKGGKDMKKTLGIAIIIMLIGVGSVQARDDIIAVIGDPGYYGVWGYWQYCPKGSYAAGYNMQIESWLGHGKSGSKDDTAVNGISLICINMHDRARVANITSVVAEYGRWRGDNYCPSGFFKSAQLRNEPPQGGGDDTGTNNVRFFCLNGQLIQAEGGHTSGNWGTRLTCPGTSVICGIQTRIESPLGEGDDTGLNGANFACCALP